MTVGLLGHGILIRPEIGDERALAQTQFDPVEEQRRLRNHYISTALQLLNEPDGAARIAVMKVAIGPQQAFMHSAIELAGAAWDATQDSLAALAAQEGVSHFRRFRVQEVADLTLEQRYLSDISELINIEVGWAIVPLSGRTSAMRCLASKLLSFGGCWVQLQLVAPFSNYPYTTFKLAFEGLAANDPAKMGQALLAERPCLLAPWSAGVLDHYGGEICGTDATVDVATRGMRLEVDSARREAKHSAVRRHVVRASTQSSVIGLELASGRFVDGRVRQHERTVGPPSSAFGVGARSAG